jgi:hypothetical protein
LLAKRQTEKTAAAKRLFLNLIGLSVLAAVGKVFFEKGS